MRRPILFVAALLLTAAACTEHPLAPTASETGTPDRATPGVASLGTNALLTDSVPTVTTDKEDYVPHEPVAIMGRWWQPGETVVLTLSEDPKIHGDRTFTVTADTAGSFAYEEFAPEDHHAGVRFLLTAVGQSSGLQAQTTFTDAIALGASSTNFNGAGSSPSSPSQSSLVMSAPAVSAADAAAGALLVAQIAIADDVGSTVICGPDSNWKPVGLTRDAQNKVAQAVFYRIVTAAQSATSYTWTFRASCPSGSARSKGAVGGIIRYTGVDVNHANGPTDGSDGTPGQTSTTSGTAPSVTTTGSDARVLRFFGLFKQASIGPSASPPRIYTRTSTTIKDIAIGAFDASQAAAGSTGEFTGTFHNADGTGQQSGEWVAQTVALRAVFVATGPTRLAFTTAPFTGVVGQCLGPITVQTQNASSAPTNVTQNTTVGLATDGAGAFYGDAACAGSIASVGINTGGNSASFYYRATERGDGSHQLTASAAGLASAMQTQTINKADQTIDFPAVGPFTFGDPPFSVAATASSGLAVAFGSQTPGVCTVAGSTVTIVQAGTCTIRASQGGNASYNPAPDVDRNITIQKATPTISWSPADIDQGEALGAAQLNATAKGVGGAALAGIFTYTPAAGTVLTAVGPYTLSTDFAPSDGTNYEDVLGTTRQIDVLNVSPTLAALTGSTSDPIKVNTYVTISGSFTDPGGDDDTPYKVVFKWGDGGSDDVSYVTDYLTPTPVSGTHSYAAAGVYPVAVEVEDKHGGKDSRTYEYVVVYDPDAGFVTGGGWINSPAGAYTYDPSLTGKANFGFVSAYKAGARTPTGNTEFQFKTANLNFHSTSYQWLVVSGAKAQYKGWGKINNEGEYGFMLTAVDGQISGGGGTDKFRVKIWQFNADGSDGYVVYDNQLGAGDDATPSTVLGGGSIVIHKK